MESGNLKSNNLRFSIITPVYNRADCITRCMDSVIRNLREEVPIEHIIVDDGSTDDTICIVEKYAAYYKHIRFIKLTHNRGTNAARNVAIAAAKSEWCIILDSDDYFTDTAICDIQATMQSCKGYRHYMFASNDMQSSYLKNPLLMGKAQVQLTYDDFLSNRVDGDFIHICHTDVLRKYPFNESIRIHEGIFFLLFFKEVKQMLFTNQVVTFRERSRKDSVTRETIRIDKLTVRRCVTGNKLRLCYFTEDLQRLGLDSTLYRLRLELLENLCLLSKYQEIKELIAVMGDAKSAKERLLRIICTLRMGKCYRMALRIYLVSKYQVLHSKLN